MAAVMSGLANRRFTKMNGIGNAIVVVDLRDRPTPISPADARAAARPDGAPYDQLMAHWRSVLPGRFLDLDYEHVVRSQEQATRELLRRRADTLRPQFARAGLTLREDVLADQEARLLPVPGETTTERALRSLRGSLSVLEARRRKTL